MTEADKWVKDKNRDKVAESLAKVQDGIFKILTVNALDAGNVNLKIVASYIED